MIPIVTPVEMQAIDGAAPEPVETLIARAGWHVFRAARAMLGGVYGRRVAVLAGPGNNGHDARVAASLLAGQGVKVEVLDPNARRVPAADLVIDGAFGTGLNRPYEAPPIEAPVLAVDTPSGVNGLTGQVMGRAIAADRTVTFAALKPGLLLHPGAELAGRIEVVDIGLDVSSAVAWLFVRSDAVEHLPRRRPDDHKWKRAVWVIGGSAGMYGAPLLAAQAALRAGAGMVWCGLPGQPAPSVANEVVFRPLDASNWHLPVLAEADRFGALVVGCGMGRAPEVAASLTALVDRCQLPMVLDGDALRLLGHRPALHPRIVLTPHDGEFESLTGRRPGADRFAEARSLASDTGATVLLKGPLTVVAEPGGRCLATNRGDARLATAGTGDVLAGTIGSLLAAGLEPSTAAALGAWLHGEAARRGPSVGLVAGDLLVGLSQASERLERQRMGPSGPVGEADKARKHQPGGIWARTFPRGLPASSPGE